MTEITDYASLVSAVQAAAEDDSTEFSDFIPTAIGIAEQRLTRELDSLGLEFTTTVSVSAGNQIVARPPNVRLPKVLSYTNASGEEVLLHQRTKSFVKDYWPVTTSVGEPKYYANEGFDNFILVPTPVSAINIELTYQGRPDALTSANTTNFFTTVCPDALFHGTMVEQSKFMKYWSSVPHWKSEFEEDVQGVLNEARRSRREEALTPNHGAGNNLRDGDK